VVAGWLADQQVLGNTRVSARLLGEQLGGTAVALRTLRARELRIGSVADQRMHEGERPPGLKDPRGRQQIGCIGGRELFEAGESRRLQKVALLEYRQCSREPPRMFR